MLQQNLDAAMLAIIFTAKIRSQHLGHRTLDAVFCLDGRKGHIGSCIDEVLEPFRFLTLARSKDDGAVVRAVLSVRIGPVLEQKIGDGLSRRPTGTIVPEGVGQTLVEIELSELSHVKDTAYLLDIPAPRRLGQRFDLPDDIHQLIGTEPHHRHDMGEFSPVSTTVILSDLMLRSGQLSAGSCSIRWVEPFPRTRMLPESNSFKAKRGRTSRKLILKSNYLISMPRPKLKKRILPFKIIERAPSLEEYTALINAVGWAGYTNLEPIPIALQNSLFCVVALKKSDVIGMGRLTGDGARFINVNDIMVLPQYQGQGVGTAIMDTLMTYIDKHAPRKTYIHLFTEKKTSGFYERYGFKGPEQSFYGMSVKKFDEPLQRRALNSQKSGQG